MPSLMSPVTAATAVALEDAGREARVVLVARAAPEDRVGLLAWEPGGMARVPTDVPAKGVQVRVVRAVMDQGRVRATALARVAGDRGGVGREMRTADRAGIPWRNCRRASRSTSRRIRRASNR